MQLHQLLSKRDDATQSLGALLLPLPAHLHFGGADGI